ncbi:V-type ATP synthase subunit I [Deinococcus sp. LM3]|uniref:V-type ATP synthase subunit I n=1 Tax=unclassified Deinococcus TaxID=2623546 RepID=UPI00099381EF|nr:V-type ATP synthase subunit I [Deinococcus sp. LM3]MBX8464707.1 V-type ATP synthase subunit I [Deinococcus sp. RIT780]MCD0164973.1 V-type ATP synthase subunit I [Deinococcus sp. 12RED42]
MINPMQQVVIATRKRDSDAVIAALQNAGVLHLKPITGGPLNTGTLAGPDAQSRREDERLLARVESTLAELGSYRPAPAPLPAETTWADTIEQAALPVATLARQRQELQADLDAEATYGDAVRALSRLAGGLDRSRRVATVPFLLQPTDNVAELEAALNETLRDRHALATETVGQNRVGLIATLTGDRDAARAALGRVRLGELRLPGRFDSLSLSESAAQMEQIARSGETRQRELNAERDRLAQAHAPVLYAIRDALKDRVAVHDVRAVAARGKYSLALQGYVPEDRAAALNAALAPFGDAVSYELHPADDHHDSLVPVELKNNGYVRPFQVVMGLMTPPKYGTFDPTWVVALFFPLFFGIIMADIGYGLMFLAFGMWLLGKARRNEGWNLSFFGAFVPPATLKDLGFVTNVMAAWTIVWGFLTGEFFGTLLEHMHFFYINPELLNSLWSWTGVTYPIEEGVKHYGVIPIVFPRLETGYFSNVALVFALCFGILQVLWAWAIRIQQGIKHKDSTHTWEGIALFGGVLALIMLAFATKAGKDFSAFTDFSDPRILIMYAGFVAFIVGWLRVIKHYPLLPVELLSQGGAVVSYARIFAVGLVSAILAKLCTDLGWSLGETLGFIGVLIGIVLGLVLHFFVLALTLIGHILQPLRLHMVEFLNPTGFNADSSPRYNPLRRLSPTQGQVK